MINIEDRIYFLILNVGIFVVWGDSIVFWVLLILLVKFYSYFIDVKREFGQEKSLWGSVYGSTKISVTGNFKVLSLWKTWIGSL